MIPHLVFGAIAALTASAGAIAGLIVSQRKMRAMEVLAETVGDEPKALHPFRSPAVVRQDEPTRALRRRERPRHSYDLHIGRTFAG